MKRERLDGLLAKVETVYGTDALPVAGTDGVQLDERLWSQIEVDYLERNTRENAHTGRLSPGIDGAPSGRFAHITLTAVLKGAGVAYTAGGAGVRPEIDALLRAAGHAAVFSAVPTPQWSYTGLDDGQESATLYAYAAGSLFKIVGARGKVTFDLQAAKNGMVKFEFWGLLAEDPTDAALPAITYPRIAVQAVPVASSALLLDAFGATYKSLSIDPGIDVTAAPRGNAADGHAGYEVTGLKPSATVVIDSPAKAAFNAWAREKSGAPFTWSLALGQVQYNRMTFAGALAQMKKVSPQADNGYAMLSQALHLASSPTDPPYTILFN